MGMHLQYWNVRGAITKGVQSLKKCYQKVDDTSGAYFICLGVMIVRPGPLFFLLYSLSLALRTMRLPSYLLHALSLPLLYYIRVHQYLPMCTFCAPFVPVFPHHYLMYHCTFCARFPTP